MAADANVTLIDEHDLLMQDLATFGGISAEYLHFRTTMVSENDIQMSYSMVRDHMIEMVSKVTLFDKPSFLKITEWKKPLS